MIEGLLLAAAILVSNATQEPSRMGWDNPVIATVCAAQGRSGAYEATFKGVTKPFYVEWQDPDTFWESTPPNAGAVIRGNVIYMPADTRRCEPSMAHELDHLFGNAMVEHVGE